MTAEKRPSPEKDGRRPVNEERINAALYDATDTQTVTIGAGALSSVADIFE